MTKPYGILNYLDISTLHIAKSDAEALNFRVHPNGAYLIGTYTEGWVLAIGEYDASETTKGRDYSPEFYAILDHARKNECVLLRIDADGMEFPEFPIFNW